MDKHSKIVNFYSYKRLLPENTSIADLRKFAQIAFENREEVADWYAAPSEFAWTKFGSKYVKLFPSILNQFTEIALDIDCKFIPKDYGCISVRLPTNNNITFDGMQVTSFLLWQMSETIALILCVRDEQSLYRSHLGMKLEDGVSIEKALDEFCNTENVEWNIAVKSLYKIAISTLFFLTKQHKLILPDLRPSHTVKYIKAKAEKDEKTAEELVRKAKKYSPNGFMLGIEEDLPFTDTTTHIYEGEKSNGKGTGCEHNWASTRKGHLRLQPYGPKDDPKYELIFIAPTVVRADLPFRPVKGYRIKG